MFESTMKEVQKGMRLILTLFLIFSATITPLGVEKAEALVGNPIAPYYGGPDVFIFPCICTNPLLFMITLESALPIGILPRPGTFLPIPGVFPFAISMLSLYQPIFSEKVGFDTGVPTTPCFVGIPPFCAPIAVAPFRINSGTNLNIIGI